MTRGEKLKELRKKMGKSQGAILEDIPKKLGDNYNLNKNTLSSAENDENIANTTLEILANYYEVSFDYLKNDIIENSTNENIEINRILGFSDKSIEKIKKAKDEIHTENNGFNTWIEENKAFDDLNILLDKYYMLKKAVEINNKFIDIDSKNLLEINFDNLIECHFNMLNLLRKSEVNLEDFDYLFNSLSLLEQYLKSDDKCKITEEVLNIKHLGQSYFNELKKVLKYVKFELSENFSASLPI